MSSSAPVEVKKCADSMVPMSMPAPGKTASPSTTTTTSHNVHSSIAQDIFARVKPFLSEEHIEMEARFCNYSAPQLPSQATTSSNSAPALHVLNGSYGRIQVGVSADDFTRMRTAVEAKKLPMKFTKTEDVITDKGRYTYVIADDGSESFAGCMEKQLLCTVEVHVTHCPYDIRLSVSTEVPRKTREAPTVKPQGFVRQKNRWTVTEDTYEYAFTRVGGPAYKKATFEVEIEGIHMNAQEGVTVAWLEELIHRLLAMALLEGNTGLPKNTAPSYTGRKRLR